MANYPKITGNTGGTNESRYDLGDFTDNRPDVYVFKNPVNGVQEAFMLLVIRNTSSQISLSISSFEEGGYPGFNEDNGYYLNPTQNSVTGSGDSSLPFLGGYDGNGDRVNKVYSSASSVIGSTTESNVSGAVGFIGIGSQVADSGEGVFTEGNGDEFNSNPSNIIPIYSTSFLIANPIPIESYAAILIRYAPTEASSSHNTSLLIKNNARNFQVRFNATAVNLVSYFGKEIAYSNIDGDANLELGADSLYDGNTLDLGLWPTITGENAGLDTDLIGKHFQFNDYSATPGSFHYSVNTSDWMTDLVLVSPQKIDGQLSDNIGQYRYGALINSFFHSGKDISTRALYLAGNAGVTANSQTGFISFAEGINTPLIKSFKLNPDNSASYNDFTTESSHSQASSDIATYSHERYKLLEHTDASSCTVKANYRLGKVINSLDPSQVLGTSNYLYFTVSLGFYSVLSFNSSQVELHKESAVNADGDGKANTLDKFVNYERNSFSEFLGPKLLADPTDSESFMDRDNFYPLNIHVRYNNFSGSDAYAIPSFEPSEEMEISGKFVSHVSPIKYLTEEFIGDRPGGNDFSNGTDASIAFSGFNTESKKGSYLGLLYNLRVAYEGGNSMVLDHIYGPASSLHPYFGDSNVGMHGRHKRLSKLPPNDQDWGIIWFDDNQKIKPKYGSIMGKYLSERTMASYMLAVLPKQSQLTVDSVNDPGGDQRSWKIAESGNKLSCSTTKETINDYWYPLNSSTSRGDASPNSQYGWYGSGGLAIYKPYCWNTSNTGGYLETSSGTSSLSFTTRAGQNGNIISSLRPFLNSDLNTGTKPVIVNAPRDPIIQTKLGNGRKCYESSCDYFFTIDDVEWDSVANKFKAVGVLKLGNTGDYPIYIQRLEVNDEGHKLDGYNAYSTTSNVSSPNGNSAEMLVPTANTDVKPASGSNDPIWKVSQVNADRADFRYENHVNSRAGEFKFYGQPTSFDNAPVDVQSLDYYQDFPTNISAGETKIPRDHYYVDNEDAYEANVSTGLMLFKNGYGTKALSDGNRMFIPGHFNESPMDTVYNEVAVTFELTSTGSGATNNGWYYTQLAITYFIDEYGNNKTWELDPNAVSGVNISTVKLGEEDNISSRLYVAKYLVGVYIESTPEIKLFDAEGDELGHDTLINLGNLNVG